MAVGILIPVLKGISVASILTPINELWHRYLLFSQEFITGTRGCRFPRPFVRFHLIFRHRANTPYYFCAVQIVKLISISKIMKSINNILICGILLITNSCFSQSFMNRVAERLYFGVKAGANYSNFSNAKFDTKGLVGFHAGAIVGFTINDHFSVQEEFLYSQQGAIIKGGLIDGKEIKLSYVSVPILVHYKTNFGLYFEAGPQVGILVHEAAEGLTGSDSDFAEKIDAGIVGGIGYQLKNGLGIGIRYYNSFTDVSKVQSSGFPTKFQNSMAQASLFYIF